MGSKIAARVPVASLHPAPWNPRTLTEERFENLKRSLAADPRLLELRPILADADGEVYAGNMRLRAAIALGWADVPAVLEDVDDLTRKERMVRDNAQWGEWQDDELAEVLHSIAEAGADTSILGLDEREMARIIDGIRPPLGEDDVPSLDEAPTRAQPGELWQLGTHRLLCGDSADVGAVSRLLGNERAEVLWTDPPYGVSYVGKTRDALTIKNDGSDIGGLLATSFAAADSVMAPGARLYIACPAGRPGIVFRNAVVDAGWTFHETLVWVKDSMVLGHSDYHLKHEEILYGYKPGQGRVGRGDHDGSRWYGDDSQTSVFEVDRPKRSTEHPTMKPTALIVAHLRNSSKAGDIVLDCFAGSGSTLIAAHELGRRACLMEIDPRYCDVILARWEKLTGGTAVLQ